MRSFAFVVSLGYRCRTMQRLREHFGSPSAFPFDWWNTPIEGLTRFLGDWDVERLYDPARLRVHHRVLEPSWVEHADYGIGLVHEFKRDRLSMLLGRYRDQTAEPKARTAHLMRKFEKLNRPGWRVLFVRNLSRREEARPEACAALRRAVLDRVGEAEAEFMLISSTGVQAEGWIPLKIDDPSKTPWSGDPAIWDPALDSLGFRVERPDGQPLITPARPPASGRRDRPLSEALAARSSWTAA